jgi:protein transport protein SEC31
LGKPADPTVYTPGAKPQQASDIASVAWNKKVQHILASTQFSGLTVIWDLKAKKPVINFADRNSKARSKSIAWHPAEATQILTASEEDDAPVLQMWDLRNVFTPVRTFNGHTRGVWGVSWSPFDHSLVLSCGKDNRTLCWNVETAEVLCEVESGSDSGVWNIDVQWSPRIPAVLSTSSLEGKVSIYALQDVCERTVIPSADSFGGTQIQATPSRTAPKHTPGWLQRPCGVAFGFGGKLVSFERNKDPKAPRNITVSSVVTEKEILDRSEKLEDVINSGKFTNFCDEKVNF